MGKDYGGRITIRLSSGAIFSLRGTLTLNPSSQSNEAVTNQDGSVDRIGTPKGPMFAFTFADKGIDYDALMKADRFNATVEEEFGGRTHYYTGCVMTGDPEINSMNGEVSGLTGVAEKYNRTGN